MSLELSESSMFGGTAIEKRESNDYQLLIIIETKWSQFFSGSHEFLFLFNYFHPSHCPVS